MKKVFLAMMFVVITAVSAQAQFNIGIRAGMNVVGVHGDAVPVFAENSSIESSTGFQVGVVGKYGFRNWFWLGGANFCRATCVGLSVRNDEHTQFRRTGYEERCSGILFKLYFRKINH